MKKLITLILFSGLSVFAATKEQLTFELITAAQNDNVAAAIQLLNQGADPLLTVKRGGDVVAPAIFEAALSGARFGKDLVYKELVKRNVSLNTAVDLGWRQKNSVLEYVLTEARGEREKFEPFILRLVKDGANPFAHTLYSDEFTYIVFGDYTQVLAELMKKEIRKESWLWYTHSWTMRFRNFAGEEVPMQKLMAQFEKYFPILQNAGVSIYDWGYYGPDEEKPNGPIRLQKPTALEFVSYKANAAFINAFIARGFDVNKVIYNQASMCDVANVVSIQDVQTLVSFDCNPTNHWTLSALIAGQFKTAEKVLSLGLDIDAPFLARGKSYTVLTFLRSSNSKPKELIDWAIKHGANPNQPQPSE